MLLRLLAGFLFALLPSLVIAQDLPIKFDPQRDAVRDVMTAQNLAKTTGRRVLVDVGGQWCGWCRKLDRFIASQPQIKTVIESHYVWLKVNYSAENRNTTVLSKWPKVRGFPYLLVLDSDGKLLHSQGVQGLETETENEADEDYDPDRVMAFLKRFAIVASVPAAPVLIK
jgi:thioredoxin-related protein